MKFSLSYVCYVLVCAIFAYQSVACSSTNPQLYTLTIYQGIDCNYCKFANQQIQSLHDKYHWHNVLKLIIVDCSVDLQACRDNFNKPRIVLSSTQDGSKIK